MRADELAFQVAHVENALATIAAVKSVVWEWGH